MGIHNLITTFIDNRDYIRMAAFGAIKEAELQKKEGTTFEQYIRLLGNELLEAANDGAKWMSQKKIEDKKRGNNRQS